MSDYWHRDDAKKDKKAISRDTHDRLRIDIEKILGSSNKLNVLKPYHNLKAKEGKRGLSAGRSGKSRRYGLSLEIGSSKDNLGPRPKFAGSISTKAKLTMDPTFKGTFKNRKVQTPNVKGSDRAELNQEQKLEAFAPKGDEYKNNARNMQKAKLKRRYNHSISGVCNYKLEIDAPKANEELRYHESYTGIPKSATSYTGRIITYVKLESYKPTLKTKEESQHHRDQISQLIKSRLDSNKDKLLKHEDNQSYIRRVKQMLQSSNMLSTPLKTDLSTPLRKQFAFSSMIKSKAAQDQAMKINFAQNLSQDINKSKLVRFKNKSLDTRDTKKKPLPHKRHISMKKSMDLKEKDIMERQSSHEKKSLLKSFLDIVKKSPPEKHITPKYAHRSARTASFHDWHYSPLDDKKGVVRMNSLKKDGSCKSAKKSYSPSKNELKIDNNLKSSIPKTSKGKTSSTSLFFKNLTEKAKNQGSAKNLFNQQLDEHFETLVKRPGSSEIDRNPNFTSPSTGESPAKTKQVKHSQSEAKPERISTKSKNFNSFSGNQDTLLIVDIKKALTINMDHDNKDSIPAFFDSLKSITHSDPESATFTGTLDSCLMASQAANIHALQVTHIY